MILNFVAKREKKEGGVPNSTKEKNHLPFPDLTTTTLIKTIRGRVARCINDGAYSEARGKFDFPVDAIFQMLFHNNQFIVPHVWAGCGTYSGIATRKLPEDL